ncbi:MAG: AsmA family protein [Deltaproteobacteria bacterium]|nr:AsmA family protein [Deltaproteobacteria bacterium]
MGVLFSLAVSIFLLILALPYLINPNDYKTLVTDLVREKTGRELVLSGDIQMQISPWLNVTCVFGKVRLANNVPFANSTFIESDQVTIELSLWPLLLQKRLHMTDIILDGVTLNLLRNKEGVTNWEELPKPSETAKEAIKETTEEPTGEPAAIDSDHKLSWLIKLLPDTTDLDLGKLQLTHINIRYENRQTDKIIFFKELNLKTGRLKEGRQFPFEAGFNLTLDNKAATKPAIIRSGDIAMQGNATLFLQDPHLLLEDLRIEGAIKGKDLPKRGLKVVLSTISDIQLQPQKITIKDFSLTHEDVTLQGSGTLEDFSSPRFSGALKIPECSPASLLKQLYPALPILQDPDALTRLSAGMLIKGNMEMTEITDLTVMVDETTVTGTITKQNESSPAYEATIHINHLDLDRYTPKKTVTPPATEEQSGASPPLIPVDFLNSLLLQLDLQLDSLQVGGALLSQVQMKIAGKDGILQMAPLTAHLYDGNMKLEARMDVTGDVPQVQVKQKINKVQLAPLFQDMTGKKDITGVALVEVDINTSGLTWEEFRSHVKGTMRFEFLNGEIKPLKILQGIRTARALHQQETPPPMTGDEATEFDRLTGTGIFEGGILYNNDLMAASELMQITGGGEIDLVDRQLDFKLNVSLAPHLTQDKDMGLAEFVGKIIPYTIVGPFTDLSQEADVAKLLPTVTEKQPLQELPKQVDKKEAIQKENGADTSPEQKKQGTVGD